MGLVDTAKALKRTLAERNLPQRFVFHHVPKCGGTSVGRALRKRYILSQSTVAPDASFRAFEAFSGRSDRDQMLIDVLDLREQMLLYLLYEDVRGISLHVRFSQVAYDRFADRYKFVTILREPVARFISHYNWSHNKPGDHAIITEDFEDFLETQRAARMGASYVEYYCGLPSDADIRGDAAIQAAIGNLCKFDVAGDLADLSGFERGIRDALGVRIKVRHENRMPEKRNLVSLKSLPDETVRKVRALCEPDLAVWQAFRAMKDEAQDG